MSVHVGHADAQSDRVRTRIAKSDEGRRMKVDREFRGRREETEPVTDTR